MNNFNEKEVLKWLSKYSMRDISTISIDDHIDEIFQIEYTKEKYELFLYHGFNFLKELVKVCKNNNLLSNFIPVFRISLKDRKTIKKNNFKFLNIITKNMSTRPPEICLYRKLLTVENSIRENYVYSLQNSCLNEVFGKNYYVDYEFFKNEDDIIDNWEFHRMITISYNENLPYKNKHKELITVIET